MQRQRHFGITARSGLYFVLLFGAVNLFADFAYEGARSITGPFLASLGASGVIVGSVTDGRPAGGRDAIACRRTAADRRSHAARPKSREAGRQPDLKSVRENRSSAGRSPAFRARETVELAGLPSPKIVSQLAEYVQGMASSAEESHGAWLVQAVDIAPPAGINTLIITLTPNIVGAFGRDTAGIRAGEVLVFRAEPGHPARLLGRITVERLAGLGRHP